MIIGSAGADRINGNGGIKTLIGGLGPVIFLYSIAPRAGNTGRIQVYVTGEHIEIEDAVFTALMDTNAPLATLAFAANFAASDVSLATLATHRSIYLCSTGFLFYDAEEVVGPATSVNSDSIGIGTALFATDFTVV